MSLLHLLVMLKECNIIDAFLTLSDLHYCHMTKLTHCPSMQLMLKNAITQQTSYTEPVMVSSQSSVPQESNVCA